VAIRPQAWYSVQFSSPILDIFNATVSHWCARASLHCPNTQVTNVELPKPAYKLLISGAKLQKLNAPTSGCRRGLRRRVGEPFGEMAFRSAGEWESQRQEKYETLDSEIRGLEQRNYKQWQNSLVCFLWPVVPYSYNPALRHLQKTQSVRNCASIHVTVS
jgi:hypothetical protein